MKKKKALTDRLIEELERTPLIQVACEKVGIVRNTFYRWLKEDPEFFARVNEAISLGTGLVHDVAISNVLTGIQKGDPMYTKYWLSHRHPDFRKPFILKFDADDHLQYKRLVNEKGQAIRAEREAIDAAEKIDDTEMKDRMKRMLEWQERFEQVAKDYHEKDRVLFEKWKQDRLKSNRPPNNPKD